MFCRRSSAGTRAARRPSSTHDDRIMAEPCQLYAHIQLYKHARAALRKRSAEAQRANDGRTYAGAVAVGGRIVRPHKAVRQGIPVSSTEENIHASVSYSSLFRVFSIVHE